jgi:predicted XRE-type DNA-binding protein
VDPCCIRIDNPDKDAMNSAKRARLESKGWRVGDAKDFLNLSKEEAAFVEMKLALAECLRASRIRRNLSQTRVAELVGSSQSRVAKMESGDPSVSVDLLLRAVLAIGETPRQIIKAFAGRKKLQSA